MINFEKELEKFQPSLEIDEAEEAIFNNDLTDLHDIIETIMKGKELAQLRQNENEFTDGGKKK